MSKCYVHTRHIPIEHLNLNIPMGQRIVANGLPGVLEGDNIKIISNANVEYIETRLVFSCLEKEEGKLDFSRVDRDIDRIEKLGFMPALFVWPQHVPKWVNITRLKCLEHGLECTVPSLWEPKLLEYYDHVYGETAKRYGDRIKFLYFGIYGDYGEYTYPLGVKQYIFSSEHTHDGKWCGDELAKADFAKCMKEKYGSIEALNRAWGTEHCDFSSDMMPGVGVGGIAELDRERWYADSLTKFTDKVCAIIRKHFPNTRGAMPLGIVGDRNGLNKSDAVKLCAKYNITPRWTGWAHLSDFGRSDSLCKRVSSAARLYGTDFGLEAALELYEDNAGNAVFEARSNGAVLIHNDPGNYARAPELYRKLTEVLCGELPIIDTAVFYPLEDIWLSRIDIYDFAKDTGIIRAHTDYDLADSGMICEGFLERVKTLILTDGVTIPEKALKVIRKWKEKGGIVKACGKVFTFESGEEITDFEKTAYAPVDAPIYKTEFASGTLYYDPANNKIFEKTRRK